MNNQNDPDPQNNANPASPFGAPAQPLPDSTSPFSQTPQPLSSPASDWPAPSYPEPVQPPPASTTTDTTTPVSSAWPTPADTGPAPFPPQIPSDPGQIPAASDNGVIPDFNSAWIPPVQTTSTPAATASEPLPSAELPPFQPSSDTTLPPGQIPTQPEPSPSPFGEQSNPLMSSPQPNPAQSQPIPTFAPTNPQTEQPVPTPAQPSWTGIPESAPTDLSHLITSNSQQNPTDPAPETLVVPPNPASNPEASTMSAEGHKGIPKWLFGVAGGLLILVIGASAYFILGIGQPVKTTSLPATTTPTTEEVNPPQPVATPVAQPAGQPAATGSANFGELGGGASQPVATGSSVIETLRQRQQQGQ